MAAFNAAGQADQGPSEAAATPQAGKACTKGALHGTVGRHAQAAAFKAIGKLEILEQPPADGM